MLKMKCLPLSPVHLRIFLTNQQLLLLSFLHLLKEKIKDTVSLFQQNTSNGMST